MQRWRIEGAKGTESAVNLSKQKLVVGQATCPPIGTDADAIRKMLPDNFGRPLIELKSTASRLASKNIPQIGSKVGVAFCGRQAPGCHDLLFGMVENMKQLGGEVMGFVGGVNGLYEGHAVPLADCVDAYRRMGGIDLLGRSADKLADGSDDCEKILKVCEKLGISGLVCVGGTRTATDVAYLAEHIAAKGSKLSVVLAPCGIENSLRNPFVETSLGFDSASKTVAQVVANTCTDGASARKYYYFLRTMDGSSTGLECTSHITMEIALSVRPNMALHTSEINDRRWTLQTVVKQIADVVCQRAAEGKNFGTIVIPETLLAATTDTRVLLEELGKCKGKTVEETLSQLSQFSAAFFKTMPKYIQDQLVLERQSNGTVQLSQVSTEEFIAGLVSGELDTRKSEGKYKGGFSAVCQFVGYQARTSMPSTFDSEYGRALGGICALLASHGHNGYFGTVSGLAQSVQHWRCAGAPISAICSSTDEGVRCVPQRLSLQGPEWQAWKKLRKRCICEDLYNNPGPVQLSGVLGERITDTLFQRGVVWGGSNNYIQALEEVQKKIERLKHACQPGCESSLAIATCSTLSGLEEILFLMGDKS